MAIFLLLPFLFGGLAVFLLCLALPWLQRFALSAALWFLALLPGLLLWLLIEVGAALGEDTLGRRLAHPRWEISLWHAFGSTAAQTTLIATGIAGTIVFATIIAVIHQFAIQRITFALFRLYAGLVTGGVAVLWGSLAGAVVASWLDAPWEIAFVVVTILVVAIGWGGARLGCRMARRLRGRAPVRFTWISEEEFYGTAGISVHGGQEMHPKG